MPVFARAMQEAGFLQKAAHLRSIVRAELLAVVGKDHDRAWSLGRDGSFHYAIGKIGDSTGGMFRPKGIGVDSEGDLYVVDGSFFPSCGAVNPSLTIVANALRVGDHLLARLK